MGLPEVSPDGRFDCAKLMLLPTELVALNFTVPAMFVAASLDKVSPLATLVTSPLTWIEPDVITTGMLSASAFPALSVASTTTLDGLAIPGPE